MRQKSGYRRLSGRMYALILAVLIIVSSFVQASVAPAVVNAAASATLSAGETVNIYLQDTGWQGSKIRVRYLNSGGTQLGEQTLTPSSNKVTATAVANTAKIVVEKVNDSKNTVLTAMKSKISANSGKDVVFCEKNSGWSAINVYAWNSSSNSHNAAFPGAAMESVSGSMYFKAFNSGAFTNVIFNGGGDSTKTEDLTLTKATDASPKYYDPVQNKWVVYTDVERTITVSVGDRVDNGLNDLYLTSKTSAKWSKYNASSTKKTVYFKPSSVWSTAYVHYDDDDDEPFYTSVAMTKYSDSPLIFKADVYFGAYVSFSTGADFKNSEKKDQGSIFIDENDPAFVSKSRSWTTLDHALESEDRYYDREITNNNFSSVTPTGDGTVVGFDAYYYDYFSNNEIATGWKNNLVDDNYSDDYRKQFSALNDGITDKALGNTSWRYPLLFGDDYNATYYIPNYYNRVKNTRSPGISESNFKAVNNSNFLDGDNSRSVMGLVKSKLVNGNLMVTDNTVAPFFDDSWLSEGETLSSMPASTEIWIGNSGIYDLQFGTPNVNNWVQVTGYTTKTVDGKSYNVIKNNNSQLSGRTHVGWRDSSNNWHQYQLSSTWGKAISAEGRAFGAPYAEIIKSKFPFVEKTDPTTKIKTYTFQSEATSSANRKDNISFDWANNKVNYYTGDGVTNKRNTKNGFFPMNQKGDTVRNYGFGVRVDMDFTLPENGMLTSTKPAEFNYSGDDDVWVYIDGQLVLDLGGAHTPTTGRINFGAGVNTVTATADNVYGIMNSTEKTTPATEFIIDKTSAYGYLVKWDGGKYPGSGEIPWSSLSGKAFSTNGSLVTKSGFASYEENGKYHIFVINDGSKSNVAIYATDNSLGNWNDCVPTNSTYKSMVTMLPRTVTEPKTLSDDVVDDAVTKTFSINNTDPTKKHKMTVFYMERGTNDSNLRIEFSIQPLQNELNVYKEVEVEDVNAGIEDEVTRIAKNADFDFTFNHKSSGYGGSSGKTYKIRHNDDTTTTGTIRNGAFTLKHYEEAMFSNDTDLTFGDRIKLVEAADASVYSYDTDIDVKDNLNGTSILSARNQKQTEFDFKNLPESGVSNENERTVLMAEFTNKLKTAPIWLEKNLYQEGTTTKSENPVAFDFTLKLDLEKNGTYKAYDVEYQYDSSDTVYTAENGLVHMRPDQKIRFMGIPVGTPYQITESYKAGYVNKGQSTVSGTVSPDENTVTFNNEERPASQNLAVSKTLDGNTYSGSEFTFKAEILKWIKPTHEVVTTGLDYTANSKSTVGNDGRVQFDKFTIIPSDANKGDYIFKLTETDKTSSQPKYSYDSTVYYAKIEVTAGEVKSPVYYTNEDCTATVGTDGKTPPVFSNTTKKGTITVTKEDVDHHPVSGTQFAAIKVSSEADVDSLLTPEAINRLVEANKTDSSKVLLETTAANGKAQFSNLLLYQSEGMFKKSGSDVVWSTDVSATAKQVYCVFEYTPKSGFLPNYSKTYVTLADEQNAAFTFGLVDAKVIMPNSSGSGTETLMWLGLGILGAGALLSAAYAVKRRVKPRYVCRH